MKKEMIKKMKGTRGITLIALVVTIVVLLILAGITINMLLNDNGIFKKAQDAKEKWEKAQADEINSLNNIANLIDGNNGGQDEVLTPPENNIVRQFNVGVNGDNVVAYIVDNEENPGYYEILFVGQGEIQHPDYWEETILGGCSGYGYPIKTAKISSGITNIPYKLFMNVTTLETVTIPSSVTKIYGGAFLNTKWYNDQPDGDVYIGKVYYEYKGSMPAGTSVTIKEGTVSISEGAFQGCSNLNNITIPNSVTTIGSSAFSFCTNLSSITIPNKVTTIEERTFEGCTNLSSITIPNSITKIENYAFSDCTSLSTIAIPSSVTILRGNLFTRCTNLTSITIPNSITKIENCAFSACTNLSSITIPNSVTEIQWNAFISCTNLSSITIPNSVTTMGPGLFEYWTSSQTINVPSRFRNQTDWKQNCNATINYID